jgi:hypothetical protein
MTSAELQCACQFLDAGSLISVSPIDGVHLDAAEHETLGRGIAVLVRTLLSE